MATTQTTVTNSDELKTVTKMATRKTFFSCACGPEKWVTQVMWVTDASSVDVRGNVYYARPYGNAKGLVFCFFRFRI